MYFILSNKMSKRIPYREPPFRPVRERGEYTILSMFLRGVALISNCILLCLMILFFYGCTFRIPELGPQIRMLVPPPSKSYSGASVFSATAPRFKNAAITPTVRAVPWKIGREVEDSHLQLYQRYTL